jgi:hypothetical protein
MAAKLKTTRTMNPLHFEDLEPHRFEDLIRQLAHDFRNWASLEPTGRLGSDEGYDARGIEILSKPFPSHEEEEEADDPAEAGHEKRLWQIQCKRERSVSPKKIAAYIEQMIPDGATVPYGVIFAAPADFSKKTRDVFKEQLRRKGVREFYLWGKADIEDLLYQPKNDHLLYVYFGISLQTQKPSLVFVFGAPLGDNNSPTWIMMLKHFGPNPAHNCNVDFYDADRKNIEGQWLAEHPHSPFPPPGLAGQSQVHSHVPEANPLGSIGSFQWTPLDPNRQHYTVSISCRDGIFIEDWEVTRVNGILRTRISIKHGPEWIEKNPKSDPVVFACADPEFLPTPLASALPAAKVQPVHPGWKPNHKFELPVAIIDPNGHVQVAGIKLPDGSVSTGFVCWNILTRHLGDTVR